MLAHISMLAIALAVWITLGKALHEGQGFPRYFCYTIGPAIYLFGIACGAITTLRLKVLRAR